MNNREIDKLIEEKVFGNVVHTDKRGILSIGEPDWCWIRNEGSELLNPVPLYSENIEDAFKVIEKLNRWCYEIQYHCLGPTIHSPNKDMPASTYIVKFPGILISGSVEVTSYESLPKAICIAALESIK